MLWDEALKKSSQLFIFAKSEVVRMAFDSFTQHHTRHEQPRRTSIPGRITSLPSCSTISLLQTYATTSCKLAASRMDRAQGARRDALLLQCCIRNELMGQANTRTTWPAWHGPTWHGPTRNDTTLYATSTHDARTTTARCRQLSPTSTLPTRRCPSRAFYRSTRRFSIQGQENQEGQERKGGQKVQFKKDTVHDNPFVCFI